MPNNILIPVAADNIWNNVPVNPDHNNPREELNRLEENIVRIAGNEPRFGRPNVRAVLDDGRMMPQDLARIEQEVAHKPQPLRRIMNNNFKKIAAEVKNEYPEGGVFFQGYIFSRKLKPNEKDLLSNFGYKELIYGTKDLEYKEKEKPINVDEEVLITISELADYYATEECKATIQDFDIKQHNNEYQVVFKKHTKAIVSFKRNKNG